MNVLETDSPINSLLLTTLTETKSVRGCIYIVFNEDLIRVCSSGPHINEFGLKDSNISKAIKTKTQVYIQKKVIVNDIELLSFLCLPIVYNSKVIGVITLDNPSSDKISSVPLYRMLVYQFYLEYQLKKSYIDDKFLKTKDLFLASMSHEIRTPLNGIVGYTQLLLQTKTTEVQRQYLFSMNKCCFGLTQIINDILDYSKLSAGKMKLNNNCCKIQEIIDYTQKTLYSQIQDKSQELKISISDDVPESIIIDKTKLIQILMNLLSNAVKFTDNQGQIEISLHKGKSPNTLSCSVKDTGPGISPEDQSRLFKAFSQLDSTFNKSYEGTGLGLAICKKLVDLLKGDIKIKSELGVGSEFIFTFRYDPYEKEEEKVLVSKPEKFKNKNILVFDSDAEDRIQVCEMLMAWGMKPIPCGTALEALRFTEAYDFDLCLIEISSGKTNGRSLNAIELVKKLREQYALLPLIGISVSDEYDHSLFDDYLIKPYNKVQLFEKLVSVVDNTKYEGSVQNTLPDTTEKQSGETKKPSKNSLKKDTSIKILIAEDVKYNQDLLKGMLNTLGYQNITIADDGLQTVLELQKRKDYFDVLLLDIKMPKMNGFQVLDYIKSHNIKIKAIPVTAAVLDEDQAKCASYGLKFFLKKPIDMRELRNALTVPQ